MDPALIKVRQKELLREFYRKCETHWHAIPQETIFRAHRPFQSGVVDRWLKLGSNDKKFYQAEYELLKQILKQMGVLGNNGHSSGVASTSVLGKRPQDVVDLCSDGEGQRCRRGLGNRTNSSRPPASVVEDLTGDDDIASIMRRHLDVARQPFMNCPINPASSRSIDTIIDNRTSEALSNDHIQVHMNKPATAIMGSSYRLSATVQDEEANLRSVRQIVGAGSVLSTMPNLPRGAFTKDLTNLVSNGELRRGATAAFSPYGKSPDDFVAIDGVMGKVTVNLRKNGVGVVASRVQCYDQRLSSDSKVVQMPKVVLGFHGDGRSSADNRITFEATQKESSRVVGFGMSSTGGRPIPLAGGVKGKIVGKLVEKTHRQGTISVMNENAAGVNTHVMHAAALVEDKVHLGVLDVQSNGKSQQELADIVSSTDLSGLVNDEFYDVDLPYLPLSDDYAKQLGWNQSEEGRRFSSKGGRTTNIDGTHITVSKEAIAKPYLLTEPIHVLGLENLRRVKSKSARTANGIVVPKGAAKDNRNLSSEVQAASQMLTARYTANGSKQDGEKKSKKRLELNLGDSNNRTGTWHGSIQKKLLDGSWEHVRKQSLNLRRHGNATSDALIAITQCNGSSVRFGGITGHMASTGDYSALYMADATVHAIKDTTRQYRFVFD